MLIVCEGMKTEPNYFNGLKKQLTNANVEIVGAGVTPSGIGSTNVHELVEYLQNIKS